MAPTLAQQYLHRIRDTGGDSRTKRTDCTIAFLWDSAIINRKEMRLKRGERSTAGALQRPNPRLCTFTREWELGKWNLWNTDNVNIYT